MPTPRRAAVFARVAIGVLVASTVLTIPNVAAPDPVEAACGTNWTSQVTPPPSVRVLRTASGRVETVEFRRYVATVMASGEWPSWMDPAVLEAGATASKQYAWYYALRGHHRDSYRTGGGVCYDVRDDTRDQLYRPETARPTAGQWRAVDATWPLTLRKRGRFFLTGYRAGTVGRCMADFDRWRLYARSMSDCARRLGWSGERILQGYYQPGLDLVWNVRMGGPRVKTPRVALLAGATYPAGPATVAWQGTDGADQIVRYQLQHRVGRGAWEEVDLAAPLATKARVAMRADRVHRFRVRAIDGKGDPGPWAVSDRRRALLMASPTTTLGGATAGSAEESPGRARVRIAGRSVAYVAPTGPRMGRARILVDGRSVAVVDLRSAKARQGQLVWAHNWRLSGRHRIVIVAVDASRRVDVSGFFVLR